MPVLAKKVSRGGEFLMKTINSCLTRAPPNPSSSCPTSNAHPYSNAYSKMPAFIGIVPSRGQRVGDTCLS
jgi:hypothetical protein